MIEFFIDTRVDLKTVFPHGPHTLRILTLQGIYSKKKPHNADYPMH